MISPYFLPFISGFVEKARKMEKVISIILFGSVARGEADKSSDVDLLIIVNEKNPEESETFKELRKIKTAFEKDVNFELVVMNDDDFRKADKNFIENVLNEGIILFGKPIRIGLEHMEVKPYVIFSYSLKKMDNIKKMRFLRALYGRKSAVTIGTKKYVSETEGLVKEGAKLAKTMIIFPAEMADDIRKVLERFGADYREMRVFLSQEEFEKTRR